MIAYQLIFLIYLVPGIPNPEIEQALLEPFTSKVKCEAEGKRLMDNQTLPLGVLQRTYVCTATKVTFPLPELGL